MVLDRTSSASMWNFSASSPLPLLGQGRGTEHRQAVDLAAVEQLAGDETGFDGFADPHVIGDQHAHRIELQRHHQRH